MLGLGPDATLAQARAAYRRLAELFHPDRLRGLRPEVPSAAYVDFFLDGRFHVRYTYARRAPLCFSILAGAE